MNASERKAWFTVFRNALALIIVLAACVQSKHLPGAIVPVVGSALILLGSAIGVVRDSRRGPGPLFDMSEASSYAILFTLAVTYYILR